MSGNQISTKMTIVGRQSKKERTEKQMIGCIHWNNKRKGQTKVVKNNCGCVGWLTCKVPLFALAHLVKENKMPHRNLGSWVSSFGGLALLSYWFQFIRWQMVSLDSRERFLLERGRQLLRNATRKQQGERKEGETATYLIWSMRWGDMIVYQIGWAKLDAPINSEIDCLIQADDHSSLSLSSRDGG